MKAAVCREFGKPLKIEEIEIDPPKSGEVQVRIKACAICHSDILYAEGAWGGVLPAVYGHEAAGVVEAVGPNVTRAKVGDPVVVSLLRSCGDCFFCAQGEHSQCETEFPLDREPRLHGSDGDLIQGLRTGAFAEVAVVEESQVVPVPEEVPLDSASLLACGVITGLGAVTNTMKLAPGSNAVVIGVGGVGLNSVQGAALSGAKRIIAVDLAEEKLAAASAFGATDGLKAGNDLPEQVRELTDGRGADAVFVTVGSTRAIEQGMELLRKGGSLVAVGMTPIGAKAQIEAVDLAGNSVRIIGSKMGDTRLSVDIPRLVELYRQGRLKLDELITARYPLERINEAIADVAKPDTLRNVIVF